MTEIGAKGFDSIDRVDQLEDTTKSHEMRENLAEEVDPRAIGGEVEELPKGYYRSWSFMGTFLAASIGNMCAYATFTLPTNILLIINQDLGTYAL
jgi:hypothetical protein